MRKNQLFEKRPADARVWRRVGGAAAQTARARANTEATEGRTCANRPGSTPGEVPLMGSRFALADRAASLRAELRKHWIDPIGRTAETFACGPMR